MIINFNYFFETFNYDKDGYSLSYNPFDCPYYTSQKYKKALAKKISLIIFDDEVNHDYLINLFVIK